MEIIVHTQKDHFGFVRKDEWSNAWHVQVPAVPRKNAANQALLKECTRLFGVPVHLARGSSSTRKIIRIPLAREIVEQALRTAALSNQKKK